MALINCSECSGEVSDKAAACPKCGAPVVTKATTPTDYTEVRAQPEKVDIDKVLKYVDSSRRPGNCRTVNGTGTTFGGYVRLRGYKNVGFIKKYFSLFWMPLVPLGTYLVYEWNGRSGKFVGEISPEKASQFIGRHVQYGAVFGSQLIKLAIGIFILGIAGFIMYLISRA